jgi:hypothetical protein
LSITAATVFVKSVSVFIVLMKFKKKNTIKRKRLKMESNMDWATSDVLRHEIKTHAKFRAYMEWYSKNLDVIEKFNNISNEMIKRKKFFGMWFVANKIRWDYIFKYEGDFKISNDYIALLTRDMMIANPELKKYCRIKRMSHKFSETGGQYEF